MSAPALPRPTVASAPADPSRRDPPFRPSADPSVRASADPSLAYLAGRLALLEARVGLAIAARRSHDPDPDNRLRGLYVSDAQADALLRGWARDLPWAIPADEPAALAVLETAAHDATARGAAPCRLLAVARAFDLTSLDVEILLVALAPDLDPRFERLYGYLNDDVSRRRASVLLALGLCGASPSSGPARARLAPGAPLIDGALLAVEDTDRPFLSRALRVPDRVVAHLLGDDRPDAALRPLLVAAPSFRVAAPDAAALTKAMGAGARLIHVREQAGADARAVVREAFFGWRARPEAPAGRTGASDASAGEPGTPSEVRASSTPPIVVDATAIGAEEDIRHVATIAGREARLARTGLVVGPVEALADRGAWAVRAFADLTGIVVLHGTRSWDPTWSPRVPLTLSLAGPTPEYSLRAWKAALAQEPVAERAVAGVARFPYRLGVGQVARAVESARIAAMARAGALTADDLAAGARAQNAAGLERLARRILPGAGWDALVLPPDVLARLQDLVVRTRMRGRVMDGWGLAEANRGRGVTALFAGDSGTGKTLSAEVVAGELGLDLYVIDLSRIVDKYIGETEKNLDRVFSQADGVSGVLLFDEADALFSKRSEVRDAHDRYANVEIAYLLQRMELFDGIAILTTNLRGNLDEAFQRRLDVVVDFPMPEVEHRRRLWARHLRPGLPVGDDLDLDFMAERFRVSGGNIRNIVVAAAFRAAAEDRPVSMADLIHGTALEYRKLGHLSTEAEFGPYARLVTA